MSEDSLQAHPPLSSVSVQASLKFYIVLTAVFNCEVEDVACGVAPTQKHITDLHVIDIRCWFDKYRHKMSGITVNLSHFYRCYLQPIGWK